MATMVAMGAAGVGLGAGCRAVWETTKGDAGGEHSKGEDGKEPSPLDLALLGGTWQSIMYSTNGKLERGGPGPGQHLVQPRHQGGELALQVLPTGGLVQPGGQGFLALPLIRQSFGGIFKIHFFP